MADTPFNAFTLVSSLNDTDLFLAYRAGGGINFTPLTLATYAGQHSADGTAALPGMAFASDPDTGIYRSAANQLTIVTAGTEAITVASTGNTQITSTTEVLRFNIYSNTAAIAPQISRRARGTPTAPLGVLNNDVLWSVLASGYHGTEWNSNGVGIRMLAAEDFTSTAGGTKIEFATAPLGATGRQARMMIMPDGNVGINTTSPSSKLHVSGDTLADGVMVLGTNANGWGRIATSNGLYLQSGSLNSGSSVARDIILSNMYGTAGGAAIRGVLDNTWTIGTGAFRFSTVYAATGSINTSDERSKQDIGEIPDEWLDAWGDVEWVRYKFRDAVEEKGDDARWHIGLIAQRVRDAFDARGLDALSIGLLCYDEWEEQREPVVEERVIGHEDVVVGQEGTGVLGPDGAEIMRDVMGRREIIGQVQVGERIIAEAGDRWGLRYDECQAMEAAWQRRELARKDELIADLAGRLAVLEAA